MNVLCIYIASRFVNRNSRTKKTAPKKGPLFHTVSDGLGLAASTTSKTDPGDTRQE